MKQTRISYWLKGIVIALGIMGIFFFGALTWYGFYLKGEGNPLWGWVVFSWYIAALCYVILFEFWQVCTQIGRDNSFSMENARAFRRMGFCGAAAVLGFAGRLIFICVVDALDFGRVIFIVAEVMLAAIFAILCEALSRLVQYAYEVKQENELTI
ncbi:MAG: DUF2975 domain-containing protein [Muribaculaceae bacterium]|nr:DUF2975 domain-containing protein [Roseburia sp.]MCM1432211.1 DUF2975 domain-containing protein [Muribaculaceae bacterium]MCM1491702.1 DUF2975 domain-containing protein [Muribaculaceae bacterium]